MAKDRSQVAKSSRDGAGTNDDGDSRLPGLDRYTSLLATAVPAVVQRLPSADDARESLGTTAQRAVGRARSTLNTAFDQLPELSLPEPLQNVQMPGRKPRRKRMRRRLVWVGLAVAMIAGGYIAFQKLMGSHEPDDIWESYQQREQTTPSGAQQDASAAGAVAMSEGADGEGSGLEGSTGSEAEAPGTLS